MKRKMDCLQFQIYLLGWAALLLGILFYLVWINSGMFLQVPCAFYRLTGFYCPGCGGTRALLSLLQGHVLQALWYHVTVVYGAILYVLYMLTNSVELLSGGRLPVGMKYRNGYLYVALVLMALHVLIKNLLLHVWGIPM